MTGQAGGGGCTPGCGGGDGTGDSLPDIGDSSSAPSTGPSDMVIREWLDSVGARMGAAYAETFESYGYDSSRILVEAEQRELVEGLNDMG